MAMYNEKWEVGIANRTVRVNDIVCVLAGCSSPVVIRPKRGLFGKIVAWQP